MTATLPSAPATPRRSREAIWFRAALALIAVAVLDDAFIDREPGTTVADHLVSGLVPSRSRRCSRWAYPRLRPGARAAWRSFAAFSRSSPAIVDGARHVAVDRLSGDDLTVIVAGVAGLALVARWRRRSVALPPARRAPEPALRAARTRRA